jgi:Tol biopolymer transport system component/tRNA A-37 threonylcarbamoyl transferase component Bud32
VAPEPSQHEKDAVHLKAGDRIGVYEIIAPLGTGGMGMVFKARDTKLERLVALKFLRTVSLDGDSPSTRLLREAKNASALNHPHIATIYEVGESDGRAYIAMEFVEGRPLNVVLERDSLAPETAVRYGLEIAAALAHAHDHGIVHRDLKPANVMITAAGSVKVLDFGLARRMPGDNSNAVTVTQKPVTEESSVSGTLLYMAPETLRGEPPDGRTDIWSLGAVLYEMVIGRPPFEGRTAYEISSAILREPPKSFPSHIPLRLQAVIQRCLAKEREHRYQRASEVHAALETVGADVLAPSIPLSGSTPVAAPLLPARQRRGILFAVAGVCAVVVLIAAGWGGYAWYRSKSSAPPAASSEAWVQITDFADSAVSPALSPDGKILTFIRGNETFFGPGEIGAKLMPNGDPVQLTHDGTMKMSPEFSPDGSTIAFTVYSNGNWDTWSIPVLGGDERKLFTNAEGLTWIGNDRLLFSVIKSGQHMAVVTADTNGDARRDVYVPPRERGMAHRSAISPDGKSVLVAEMDNGGFEPCRLVKFQGNEPGRRVGPPGAACTNAAWSPDGKWMYLNSDQAGRFHIWRQAYPDGEPQQLTSGPTEEEGIAVAPDGNSLITSVGFHQSTIWVRDSKGERQVSSQDYADHPQFSRDGKKIYYLVQHRGVSGQFRTGEPWSTDLTTGTAEKLLPVEVTGFAVSPDRKQVIYSAREPSGVSSLWLASLDSQFAPRKFPSSVNEDWPHWAAAGDVFFRATEGAQNFVYRMKGDGSSRQKAFPEPILELSAISPDGKWVIAWTAVEGGNIANVMAHSTVGLPAVNICQGYCTASWSPDGKIFEIQMLVMGGATTVFVPVQPPGSLPPLPAQGVDSRADVERIKGGKITDRGEIAGPILGLFAGIREVVHRNLYRIPLR